MRHNATFFYLLDYVTLGRISQSGDQKKIKIEPEPKLCKSVALLRALFLWNTCRSQVNQAGGEFQPKTSINMQLLPFYWILSN